MPTFSTDYATAQASALTDQSKSPNLGAYGGDVKYLEATVSVPGTFAVNDVIRIARLPAGARVIPSLISVDYTDPGDACTLKIGDSTDDDRYASGLALGNAAGRKELTEGTEGVAFTTPFKTTSADWLQAVITTATSAAAHTQTWHIFYTLG